MPGHAIVTTERLLLSKSPAADIAAAALEAQEAAGLAQADFIIIALEPGHLAGTDVTVDGEDDVVDYVAAIGTPDATAT